MRFRPAGRRRRFAHGEAAGRSAKISFRAALKATAHSAGRPRKTPIASGDDEHLIMRARNA